eukprot:8348231-Lingulodinium_polyedra.AAC.1
MQWLSNKPWYGRLAGSCRCGRWGAHFVTQGSFTPQDAQRFNAVRRGGTTAVYGEWPAAGQS